MTEWYLHFDPNEFAQARKVQESLLQPEDTKPSRGAAGTVNKTAETEAGEKGCKAERVLPFPAQEKDKKQKRV